MMIFTNNINYTIIGKQIVPYRSVYSKELETNVNVTTKNVLDQYIEENSADDCKFYCYVPDEIFYSYSDRDFEKYINENFGVDIK